MQLPRFIPPCSPVQRERPPSSHEWLHEDGSRIQLHKTERGIAIYTKNGNDFTRRCPSMAGAVAALPVHSIIIDGDIR